ncbi:multidrug resistance-associated protein 1 [Folsomia candida]|uniref:multidrug resistance-associated protein 1 n=1 Tax=Folsomia candida TaxID=158441 RepID=UPI000B8F9392|nr:multidrug resistance-associated protein 1 [Folsomia candida]XP_035705273.1 multidrug resistance-associated protein 1 [Folsomia candida]
MEEYCGSPFWDRNLTWDTSDPFFTPCFEDTVLIWAPAAFLLAFAIFEIKSSLQSPRRSDRVPWNAFTIIKCLDILALCAVAIVNLVKVLSYDESRSVDTLASVVRLVSYIGALALLILSKMNGVRSSGIQFLFWCSVATCEAVLFRTAVRMYDSDHDTKTNFSYFIRFFIFPLTAIQLFLNCWADGSWSFGQKEKSGKNALFGLPSPDKNSSFLSKIMYSWFDSLAWKGYRMPLEFAELWDLNPQDKAHKQIPLFYKHWNAAVKKAKEESKKTGKVVEAGIISVFAKCYWTTFVVGGIMRLVQDLLPFISPEIMKLLVAHVAPNSTEDSWKGYLYAGVLFATSILQTIFSIQHLKRTMIIGMRTRTVLSSAVYRKALVVSNAAKKDSTVGEIVNLMSVDTQRLMDLTSFIHMIWTAPIQIGLSIYFLYQALGPAVFAGLAVMILLIPLNGFIATKIRAVQMEQMKMKDNRVKLMSELLSGMKVLKLYGWEPSFQAQITKIRDMEAALLRKSALLGVSTMFTFTCAPFLVSLATFAVYVLSDETHNLNAEKTFVALSLMNIMRMPMTMFPMVIALLVQALVSIKRLNKYLNSEEIHPDAVTHNESENDPIVIRDGSFSWTDESMTLQDINFNVKKGSLTAIVGTVGSGKTSLLSSLLGDITKHTGTVNIKGSVAYVAQGAWIQNATLKDNILFNDPLNETQYRKVIEACALGPDIEILDGGDQTEIGEKGINLSGGQKQRVSLARAAYKESDVYLFDDPLSAVDAHVGKHIFDKLIGPNGILRGKTRVLVTHGVSFLPQVDNIVVMKDGRISEVGTFKELLKQKGSFAEFLSTHLGAGESEEIDESLMHEMEEIVGTEVLKRNSSIILRKRSTQASLTNKQAQAEPVPTKKKLIEEEKAETGSVKLSVFVDYMRTAGLTMTVGAIAFHCISTAASTYSNIWLSDWSTEATKDEIASGGVQNKDTTTKYLSVYGVLGGVQAITILLGGGYLALGALNSALHLHVRMLTRVMKAPMSYFDTTPLGRLVNRFAKDVDMADNVVPLNIRGTLNILLGALSMIVSICYSTPLFLAFIFPLGIFYFFLQRFYIATSRQLKRIEAVSRSPIYSKFSEAISGSITIRAFGLQEDFIVGAENKIDQNQQAYFPFIASSLWISTRLELLGGLIILAAAIFAVTSRETISPAIVGLSISSSLQITQMLNFLVRLMSELETNIVSVERMKELTETVQEAPWVTEKRPPKEWPQNGEVVFQKYETRYREGLDLVLRGISCSFNPGERIGIVGRTGAGKSSLTLALFRLIEPSGGSICIDGQDINQIGLHDLRSKITIIPQDPVLFCGNLRINLDPFDAYTDDEVWNCLESAHLKPYVSSLPQGLMYEVAEEGQNFSVGQRQLVCLARALLRKTKILVLDEATAAVDLTTDDLIQKTIRKEFAHSTVITIAHRLNTIMDSNRVVVLDKGQIVEFDSPENLLKDSSTIFYGMAKDAGLV